LQAFSPSIKLWHHCKRYALRYGVATLCIFLAVFLLYSLRIVKVTSRFATGVIAATGGFLLLYMVVWLLSLLGVHVSFLYGPTPLGIGISVVIVILGALKWLPPGKSRSTETTVGEHA
jgi:uncharacterized YccA/Bax inhibitor family protein